MFKQETVTLGAFKAVGTIFTLIARTISLFYVSLGFSLLSSPLLRSFPDLLSGI